MRMNQNLVQGLDYRKIATLIRLTLKILYYSNIGVFLAASDILKERYKAPLIYIKFCNG